MKQTISFILFYFIIVIDVTILSLCYWMIMDSKSTCNGKLTGLVSYRHLIKCRCWIANMQKVFQQLTELADVFVQLSLWQDIQTHFAKMNEMHY
jgi:hypothetical protein